MVRNDRPLGRAGNRADLRKKFFHARRNKHLTLGRPMLSVRVIRESLRAVQAYERYRLRPEEGGEFRVRAFNSDREPRPVIHNKIAG